MYLIIAVCNNSFSERDLLVAYISIFATLLNLLKNHHNWPDKLIPIYNLHKYFYVLLRKIWCNLQEYYGFYLYAQDISARVRILLIHHHLQLIRETLGRQKPKFEWHMFSSCKFSKGFKSEVIFSHELNLCCVASLSKSVPCWILSKLLCSRCCVFSWVTRTCYLIT